jgi:lysozyme
LAADAEAPGPAATEDTGRLRTSLRGIAAIAAHEGFVPGPYRDSVGVWTVYLGHTVAAGRPDPATMPRGMPGDLEAAILAGMAVFRRDLGKFEARVRSALKVRVAQHDFDAAVSFDFNTGGISRASWVRALNTGDRAAASAQMLNWRKPPEIIPRRKSERMLFTYGRYPDQAMPVLQVDAAGRVVRRPVRTVSAAELERLLLAAST